jgi:hypothetical protein
MAFSPLRGWNTHSCLHGLVRSNPLLMEVRAPGKAPQEHQQFWTRFGEEVSAVPGVRSVAIGGLLGAACALLASRLINQELAIRS